MEHVLMYSFSLKNPIRSYITAVTKQSSEMQIIMRSEHGSETFTSIYFNMKYNLTYNITGQHQSAHESAYLSGRYTYYRR